MEDKFKLFKHSGLLCFVISIYTLFILTSCSSTPSESLAVDFINTKGASDGLFKVKSLKKTNGMSEGKQYTMEYDFELECLKSNTDNPFFKPEMMGQISCGRAGETYTGKGWLVFDNTENGWEINKSLGDHNWRTPKGSMSLY